MICDRLGTAHRQACSGHPSIPDHGAAFVSIVTEGATIMATAQANTTRLYYERHGTGHPLVFIHGLGSSTRDWEAQVPAFSRSYQVITFDLRGHGQSDKPAGPYHIATFSADLADLLQTLGIGAAHIVGLSLGGAIAFQFALEYPERARTLTIVNSGPTLGDPAAAHQEIERRIGIVRQLGMRAMGQALSANLFPRSEHTSLRETFVERWAENDPEAYIEATRSLLDWDVTDRLSAIQCPTLVIAADQDYSPVTVKETYIKHIPNAQLVVIPDAHHAVPMERPEQFNTVLERFLTEHT
jgi:pimeloyl-ACP methyl ester carboxylesterase